MSDNQSLLLARTLSYIFYTTEDRLLFRMGQVEVETLCDILLGKVKISLCIERKPSLL